MPALLTHAVTSEKVLDKLYNERLLKTDISKQDIRNYSIFPDSFNIDPKLGHINHNYYILDYVKYLINYIITNKLKDNNNVITYLYGYVMHIICDQIYHPYILSSIKKKEKYGIKSKHFKNEALLDGYMIKKILNKDIEDFNIVNYCFNGKPISNDLDKMINESYSKIYNYKNASITLKISNILFNLVEHIRQDKTGKKKELYNIIGIKYFSHNLKYKEYIKIGNEEHKVWMNNYEKNKIIKNDTVMDLYNQLIAKTIEIIYEINKCIYDKSKVTESFVNAFKDNSLETGVECNYSKILHK